MPRPKTSRYWADRVAILVESEPKLTVTEITNRLEAEGNQRGRDDYPSRRTVERLRTEHRARSREERLPYGYVRWPESFLDMSLPWESARTVLDLLAWLDTRGEERPTVRLALWFLRVTSADQEADIERRYTYAQYLAAWDWARDAGQDQVQLGRWIEWALAYRPWGRADQAQAYTRATEREINPIPAFPSLTELPDDDRVQFAQDFLRHHGRVVTESETEETLDAAS